MEKTLNRLRKIIPVKLFKLLQPAYHFCVSFFANLITNNPSSKLIVIGITGTTGKTTSTYLIAKTLEKAGFKVGYTSTAMFNDGNKEWLNKKKMTMLGRGFTQKMLKRMVNNKCQYAIIETSSEGVKQFRHRFINYDVLIFTGLYPEHIESHGNFENYKKAKGDLFAHLKRCKTKYINDNSFVVIPSSNIKKLDLKRVKKTIIVNGDDEEMEYFLDFWSEEKIVYTKKDKLTDLVKDVKQVKYDNIEISEQGTSFIFNKDTQVNLQLLGDFNADNSMNAVCVGLSQNISSDKIKEGLESVSGVAGRLEKILEKQDFTVIVDYAFEPKALSKLYQTLELIPHNKIIHVLGSAGGGRDSDRRPKLGKIAGEKADFVIVTNEDPYNEDPSIIIDSVSIGAEHAGKELNKDLFKILDRRKAIQKALNLAEKDDIVLVTGKGSEQAICIENNKKIKWDDRDVVREELRKI